MARQQWTTGSIVEVDAHGYMFEAQMLGLPEFAFFDSEGDLLFRLWVHKSAYTTGRWRKVQKRVLDIQLQQPVERFAIDPISGEFRIHDGQGNDRPAKRAECEGLERAAVWDPSHVEDRLRDHAEGRPNVWSESLALPDGT